MTGGASARILGLALLLQPWGVGIVSAHALPGSVLTLSQDDRGMTLTISLPLEDLALASPAFTVLEEAPLDTALPADRVARLAAYFDDHLGIAHGTSAVPLTFKRAELRSTHDDHVGRYTLLVLSVTAGVPATMDASGLTLTYDAVMHEVRNHRATVFRTSRGGRPVMIAEFGFRPVDGGQRPVVLTPP